jgi:hypothetical protein
VVQTVTSSVVYSSGSNVFGNNIANTQVFTGSMNLTGSLTVVTTGTELQVTSTGVRIGNALTDSHIISGSLTVNPGGLFVSSSGNVGIGTNSPYIIATGKNVTIEDSTNNDIALSFGLAGVRTGQIYTSGLQFRLSSVTNIPMLFFTNDTERMRITSGGNVGIGTTNPTYQLQISSASGGLISINSTTTNSFRGIVFQNNAASDGTEYAYLKYNATSGEFRIYANPAAFGGYMTFYSNNLEKMRMFANGRTAFNNTTDRGYQLMVNGDASSYAVEFRQSNNAPNYDLLTLTHEATSGNRRMVVFNTGGYGTVGTITSDNTSTSYATTSDYRLKQDLKEFNGLDLVNSIKTYDFEWKADNSRSYGVLAHELAEVLPYAVHGDKDGIGVDGKPSYQGVDYSKIVPSLVKAIQELKAEIDELKNK